MYILYLLLALVILLLMVLVHEFGHYTIGRMLGFKITEFSVGFGKALFSRKNKRGEIISLRLFPLGGYCAFAGEEETDDKDKDAFTNQAAWKRIFVFLAGVMFNFAFAVFTSFILLCTVGYDIPQVHSIVDKNNIINEFKIENALSEPYSPLAEQQLQPGDVIISLDGKKIDFAYGSNYSDIVNERINLLTKENFDEMAVMDAVVKRGNSYENIKLSFYRIEVQAFDENNQAIEGKTNYTFVWNINAKAYVHTVGEALQRAVPFAIGLAWIVLKSLWLLITFQLPLSSIGGPITTITTIATYTQQSATNLLLLIPLISANLAIFNLLPIPALDGAHVLFTTIEAIRKKPIKRETENMIHTIGLFILFGAVILIDILHFLL
ncbi:MAG: hypothetical protein HFI85_01365 [Clostridia bacterium]|jgi:regulator of sigma E protease|nr:hypothetical protein [Clostridia bacterium]